MWIQTKREKAHVTKNGSTDRQSMLRYSGMVCKYGTLEFQAKGIVRLT